MTDPPQDPGAWRRAAALAAWRAGLAAAAPGPLVTAALRALPPALARRPRYVMAVGKAAFSMLAGAEAVGWESAVAIGPAVEPLPGWPRAVTRIGAHPVPDERSVAAAALLREFIAAVPAEALLLALISGGASAMVAAPRAGLSLAEKIAVTSRVMASGASIAELNRVRRELSSVKGGQLVAEAAAPVLTLLVSDVAGDDPRVIGSGLTVSPEVVELLPDPAWARGAAPRPRTADRFRVVASQGAVAAAVAAHLRAQGWAVQHLTSPLQGPVDDVAIELAGAALAPRPARHAVVAYGEPTVALPALAPGARPGRGGRAQQLALMLARRLRGAPVTALVAGTDGVDGPSSPAVAGALVDGGSWAALAALGLDGEAALRGCDARAALEPLGALLVTGPTGLNHADVMILLREDAPAGGVGGVG